MDSTSRENEFLFLGGSKNGQYIKVAPNLPVYRVPVMEPFPFLLDSDVPTTLNFKTEVYHRARDRHWGWVYIEEKLFMEKVGLMNT